MAIIIFLFLLISPLMPAETQMWETINGERVKADLPPLTIDGRLVALAGERSNDMMTRGYFGHTTPEGITVFDLLDGRGIYSPYAGENLGRTNQDISALISAFMQSPTHRKNILNPHYSYIGIGQACDANTLCYFAIIFIGAGK